MLGADVTSAKDDFFDFGGGSLTAAQVVSRCARSSPRSPSATSTRSPPSPRSPPALDEMAARWSPSDRRVRPIPLKTQIGQLLALVPLRALAAARWLSWLMLGSTDRRQRGCAFLPTFPVWLLILPRWSSWCRPAG